MSQSLLVASTVANSFNQTLGNNRFTVQIVNDDSATVVDTAPATEDRVVSIFIRNTKSGLTLSFGLNGKVNKGRPFPVTGKEDFIQLLGVKLQKVAQDISLNPLVEESERRTQTANLNAKAMKKAAKAAAKLLVVSASTLTPSTVGVAVTQPVEVAGTLATAAPV
jgi:hypothetical protein